MSVDDNPAISVPDEESMRTDESKQRRYEQLLDSPFFTDVVDANRAYLTAAVGDPAAAERDYWALSCLPGQPGTLSRISIGAMETFVVTEPNGGPGEGVRGYVVVAASVIEEHFGSMAGLAEEFPDLEVRATDYRDAGDDQVGVAGLQKDLADALWHERFGAAARSLAEGLMRKRTNYRNGHNYWLADHVLGRV